MALINIKFASEVLGRCTDINVIIPQRRTGGEIGIKNNAKDKKYKTVLLLHGLSDDNTIWLRRTSVERYATELGVALVLPSADRSFYTDMKYGDNFFEFISEEVLNVAREYLPLSDAREDTFAAGLSMGGYGAIKCALRRPDKFAAAAGLSSVCDIAEFLTEHNHLDRLIFGYERPIPEYDDLFKLADKCRDAAEKPRIFMGCGTSDRLYPSNLRLRDRLRELNYDLSYRESEGDHTWEFWDEYIQYAFDFFFKR